MRLGWCVCGVGIALGACGGSEFAERVGDDSGADGSDAPGVVDDASSDDASGPDADAGDRAADVQRDTAVDVDAAAAPPPTCMTPAPSKHACPSSIVQASPPYDVPSGFDYLMWNPLGTDGGGYVGCSVATTPVDCQCVETYSCACLLAHLDAPALCQQPGAVATCEQRDGAPLVLCPRVDAGI